MEGGDAIVYEHVEKYGLVAEVVSAEKGEGIYNYLSSHELNVSEGIVPQMDNYVDKGYSFIVTWINASGSVVRQPGIIFDFPTDRMYFPLILTSLYGDRVIPIDIIATDLVTPDLYDGIKEHSDVRYWEGGVSLGHNRDHNDSASLEAKAFISKFPHPLYFTRIEISAPSSAFTEDLWIDDESPEQVLYAKSIRASYGFQFGYNLYYLLFLGMSIILSLVLGALIVGREKRHIPIFFLIGLGNFLGALVILVGIAQYTEWVRKKKKWQGWPIKRVAIFTATLIISYFMVGEILYWYLVWPLL
jgi:hypothetical protein